MRTYEEVLDFIEEENVKFIRLAFFDVFGEQKNIAIMPQELRRAFAEGISIDGAAIAGFGEEPRSDLFLRPDPTTVSIVPCQAQAPSCWHPYIRSHALQIRSSPSACQGRCQGTESGSRAHTAPPGSCLRFRGFQSLPDEREGASADGNSCGRDCLPLRDGDAAVSEG